MPSFELEQSLKKPVIGVDEVGRGPIAGPVVSCACVFFDYFIPTNILNKINDSKKISKNQRSQVMKIFYELKYKKKLDFNLGYATVDEIDKLNILEATKLSMLRAINKFKFNNYVIIIDGNFKLKINSDFCINVIKGDQSSNTIAAASIIAKVHRDRYMDNIGKNYQSYNWDRNAGYGTKNHIKKILEEGITIHHRKSFDPIKKLIHN